MKICTKAKESVQEFTWWTDLPLSVRMSVVICGHLWSNLHTYICYLGKLYYLCHEFRHHSGGVRKYLIEKVLLKLSSIFKLRNFDFSMKMIAVAPHSWFVQPLLATAYPMVWAIALSMLKAMRRPEYRIKQI